MARPDPSFVSLLVLYNKKHAANEKEKTGLDDDLENEFYNSDIEANIILAKGNMNIPKDQNDSDIEILDIVNSTHLDDKYGMSDDSLQSTDGEEENPNNKCNYK